MFPCQKYLSLRQQAKNYKSDCYVHIETVLSLEIVGDWSLVTPDAREENSQSQSLSRNVPESKQNFSFPEAFSRLVNYKCVQSCIWKCLN